MNAALRLIRLTQHLAGTFGGGVVKQWPGDAIRLDAYDAEAGAGEFYGKCGFREVGRASYRNVPLIYFEMLV